MNMARKIFCYFRDILKSRNRKKYRNKGADMKFSKAQFIASILDSCRRKVIPIMTAPGAELVGALPREVFQNGELQFRCIEELSRAVPVDAQVTFMDLSIEAEAFGSPVVFSDYEIPTIREPLADNADAIAALQVPAVGSGRTAEALKCARLCAEKLDRPTFGGMIGPYSLAGRIADMTEMMILAGAEPETAHALLRKTTDFLKEYVRAIRDTGVAGVIIAEPAAGLLSPEMCQEFAADYLKEIIAEVKSDSFLVILHNCGRTEKQIPALLSTGADALHVGNAVSILDILPQMPESIPLLGNLDPVNVMKNMTSEEVYKETADLLSRTSEYKNYVLSSGCDLPPAVPMENIRAFMRAARDYNQKQEA